MNRPSAMYSLPPHQKHSMRHAMMSVYYHSLGAQWQVNGAPSVLLPPDIRPLSLSVALSRLEQWPQRWLDAIWSIVRSIPLPPSPDKELERRFPAAVVDAVGAEWLLELERKRRELRTGAQLYSSALYAKANGNDDLASVLNSIIGGKGATVAAFTDEVSETFGLNGESLLESAASDSAKPISETLQNVERELGQSVHDFVLAYADTMAFRHLRPELTCREQRVFRASAESTDRVGLEVYPVATVVTQRSSTLTTIATTTTVVKGEFDDLARAYLPCNWPRSSDVIKSTYYVDGRFSLKEVAPPESPEKLSENRLVREHAEISWGAPNDQQGSFDVVLNTSAVIKDDPPSFSLCFGLARSVESRILWDRQPGGLLLDNGYVLVRPLNAGNWRVTWRKAVRFSDRTPNQNGPGWLDTGQMISYLAPAGVVLWIESEMYALESSEYTQARGNSR